jgi:hypothetical protein
MAVGVAKDRWCNLLACEFRMQKNLPTAAAYVSKTEKEWQADCTHIPDLMGLSHEIIIAIR